MTDDRFFRIKDLAAAAADMPSAERQEFLDRECAGDATLRREVESLLRYDEGLTGQTRTVEPDGNADHGRQVSHYRIRGRIGAGGMGEVFVAEDLNLGRTVALKFLPGDATHNTDSEQRFVNEAKTASALDHPNIGVIHEINRDEEGRLYIVMGYYEGPSLRDRIAAGPLSIEEALDIAIQVGRGLCAAHERGIIHRDLKPANVMLTTDGTAKIIDFGLAKLAQEKGLTRTGTILGTVNYMSPEQIRGDHVDGRSDLFALGVLLSELLTGRCPFAGDSEAETIYRILNEPPRPLADHIGGAPPSLQGLLQRALAKDPTQRFESVAELLAGLQKIRGAGDDGDETLILAEMRVPTGKRRRWNRVGAGALVIALLLAIVFGRHLLSTADAPVASRPPALAVLDFRNLNAGDDQTLATGLSSLVSIGLVENSPVRVISSEYLLDLRRRYFGDTEGPIGDDQALAVARKAEATLLLTGQAGELDGSRFLAFRLVDCASGENLDAGRMDGDRLSEIADNVINALLPILAAASGTTAPLQPALTEALTTASPIAYRYYIAGVLAHDALKANDAITNLRQAIEADSTFALAKLELSRIHYSNSGAGEEYELARRLADGAWAQRSHLGEKDRMRLEAWRKRLDYRILDTISIYQRMIELWPDDLDVLHGLLDAYFYFYYFQEALDIARQGLDHFPDDLTFGLRYQLCLAFLGRHQEALQATRNYLAQHSGEPNAWDELGIRFLSLAMPDSAESAFGKALELDPSFLPSRQGLTFVAYARGDLEDAIELSNRFLEEEPLLPGQRVQWLTHNAFWPGQTVFYAEGGRYTEALALFDEAEQFINDPVSQMRLDTARSRLLMRMGHFDEVLLWARSVRDQTDAPLAALLEIQFGARALAALDSLPQANLALEHLHMTEGDWGGVARYEAATVGAMIALADGRPEDALADLDRLWSYGIYNGGYLDIERRELTARAYRLAGRPQDAENTLKELLRIYQGHAEAHLELGRLYLEQGRTEDAAHELRSFLEAWSTADPDLPQLADAHRLLETASRSAHAIPADE